MPAPGPGGCPGTGVMTTFGSYVGPHFLILDILQYMEVYKGIWRLFKVYGGIWKYMQVYEVYPDR